MFINKDALRRRKTMDAFVSFCNIIGDAVVSASELDSAVVVPVLIGFFALLGIGMFVKALR